ncbi:MAG: hypothetical protein V1779_16815 [bacterium]
MSSLITNCQLLITNNLKYIKYLFFIFAFIIISCSTIELPTIEESNKKIEDSRIKLDVVNNYINSKTGNLPSGYNLDLTIQKAMINRVLAVVANNRNQDITIDFPKTKNLIKDDKNVLGIQYTNYVDIDKGTVKVDLKSLKFLKLNNNRIESLIEIEGDGEISLSGKNTGISASVTSGVNLYLKDNVEFKIENAGNGDILLKPVPKKLKLKTKFSIAFLKWNIPWREEIELEFTDILSPIPVPISLATVIDLPIPSKKKKTGEFDYIPHNINFSAVKINTNGDNLIWKANCDIMNKK